MLQILLTRLRQRHRTILFPDGPPPKLPDRFRGRPILDRQKCRTDCRACAAACPTDAIDLDNLGSVDLGKCLFCAECATACTDQAITLDSDYRLAVRNREDLIVREDQQVLKLATSLEGKLHKLFGRSLKLRQVSAGGCNACEADVNVLGTIGWDLSRFGIQMVASPRHADGLLITGPVTRNMELALRKTYVAVPDPKVVIAVGACAISGGPFADHAQTKNGAESDVPIDLFIPGCPPHPLTILDGLLRLIGRVESRERHASRNSNA
jgi:Ni,Fe-hydrogenase III small subunit/Pyruvate/2-oxoacid:ferredoxin oxidoreductase delta subunit